MTPIYFAAIFASPSLTAEAFSKLQESCADVLCLRIGNEVSVEAADFFCDRGAVTRFNLLTDAVTGDVCVHIKTATRLHPNTEDFEALKPNQIFMFSHEENQK